MPITFFACHPCDQRDAAAGMRPTTWSSEKYERARCPRCGARLSAHATPRDYVPPQDAGVDLHPVKVVRP